MKTLSNGDTVAAMFNSYEVPLEARIDIFNLKHGNTRTKGTLHEYPYWLEGTELYYLEYGMYYVTSKSNLRPYKYYTESYDRVYDLFKELGILDQPDYVKAREIAVWMQTSITYGDSHSKDGTWLGIDKGVCINTAQYVSGIYVAVGCSLQDRFQHQTEPRLECSRAGWQMVSRRCNRSV